MCDGDYQTNRRNNFFCGSKCRSKYWVRKTTEANEKTASVNVTYDLPTGTVGALAELMVSTDLLGKGFEVFRAVSPACSVDLIAKKGDKPIRVEVRSARYNLSGTISYPGMGGEKRDKYDVMAAVTHKDNKIHYLPPIETLLI